MFSSPGLLPHCTEYLRKKIPNCHFPSNPCRIQFGSRQIVVFREDLLQKMSRNAIKIPDSDKLTEDVCKLI
jgi:DNA polymerase epsilon subunit 2